MIVVGERRWRAAKESGFSHIDCIIRHDLDDQKARELQFAENYLREDVPPLEQSRAFRSRLRIQFLRCVSFSSFIVAQNVLLSITIN